jgi:glycosyltransferase involved in cell wall biosynthesis
MPSEPDRTSRLFQDLTAGRAAVSADSLTPDLLRLAAYHGLIGALFHCSDPKLAESVVFRYLALVGRQKAMKGHLLRILVQLHEAGIPAAVLKGPYVAESYSQPEVRTFSDIDLLIPVSRLDEALEVLRADPAIPTIPPKKPRADKRDVPIHDPSGLVFNLDLHWDLFSYTQLMGSAAGATSWAWSHATPEPGHPLGPLWHLPPEARLAFLSAHAVLDHRFRLILFRDLAELARKGVDWEALADFAGRWKLRSFIYLAFLIARDIADAPVPEEFLSELRPASFIMTATEKLLKGAALEEFVGHSSRPLNLAIVLLHDSRLARLRLALRAPLAAPQWFRRVTSGADDSEEARATGRPAHILHVLPIDLARGAQTYAKAMRDALDGPDMVHRTVTIFGASSASLGGDIDLEVIQGIGRRLGFSPTAWWRLRRALRRWKPDVVVAHGGEALKYAGFARSQPTKLVYYKIGTSRELLRNPLRRGFHQWLARRADLVAGVSDEMVEEARTLLGARADRTVCIPNGRDPGAFKLQAEPTQVSPVRFLFVGHLTKTKRPDLFIEVIEALRERGIDAGGVMVGDGPLFADLRSQKPEGLEMLGSRNDVPELLAKGDIFLFTSTTEGEGMPGVLIEAGLAGLPVVTTDVPGARAVVADGTTGLVVPVDDTGMLIDAAERLARDPDLRKSMGASARQRCLDQFTLESSLDLWRTNLEALTPS